MDNWQPQDNQFNAYAMQLEQQRQKTEYYRHRSYLRTPLILSLIGIMCSLFFGAGVPCSIIGLILGGARYSKTKSQTHRWAIVIGIVGTAIGLLYLGCVICYIVWHFGTKEPEVVGEIIGLLRLCKSGLY